MRAWAATALLCAVAATQAQDQAQLQIEAYRVYSRAQQLLLDADIAIELSGEMKRALDQGVTLPLLLELQVWQGEGRSAQRIARSLQRIELSYLPLTRRYQLASPDSGYRRSFARRTNLMANLEQWRGWPLQPQPWPLPVAASSYRLRLSLDSGALPAPLRLPALLRRHWALDSGSVTWSVVAS